MNFLEFLGRTSLQSVLGGATDIVSSGGTAILNALFPKEFDLYLLSLELVEFTSDGVERQVDYFTFPINPDSISKREVYVKNIERSLKGVVVTRLPGFIPQEITIKGNFGKSFKILNREKLRTDCLEVDDFSSLYTKAEASTFIKSGYGSLKVLQEICYNSNSLSPLRKLYLHNFMLGEDHQVEVLDLQIDIDKSSNMIWSYILRLKTVAPQKVSGADRLKKSLKAVAMQAANDAAKTAVGAASNLYNY